MINLHPSPDQLRNYLLGKLTAVESEAVAEHLETCGDCEVAIGKFDAEVDTLVTSLGLPANVTVTEDSVLKRALSFVRRIGHAEPLTALQGEPLGQLREYRLLEKLGEGGMGAVYKALHTRLNKVVAVKVLPRDKMQSPGAVARFEREMLAVGALDHPHLIRAHDAGEIEGTHFLVMEYVAGCDLSQLVKEHGPLSIADACEAIRQAALGLQEAHEHGMVHRDIKPSNLMLTEKGQVKVLDLGLALLAGQTGGHELTSTGQIMGTVDYMAPEQGGDSHRVDIRADIYSLGATLYKLLTGDAPFAGPKYDGLMRKLVALSTDTPIAMHEKCEEIPLPLSQLVQRMLAKDPAARPATPADVVAALAPFVVGANLTALKTKREGIVHSVPPHASVVSESAETTTRTSTRPIAPIAAPARVPPRRPNAWFWLVAAGGMAAALVLAYGVILIIRNRAGQEIGRFELNPDDKLEIHETTSVPDKPKQETPAPVPSAAELSEEKPFVLVRDGKRQRVFKNLAGAVSELKSGDSIDIYSSELIAFAFEDGFTTPLHIRGAGGNRPRLSFTLPTQSLRTPVTIEHCDLLVKESFYISNTRLELRNCRVQGPISIFGPQARLFVKDSVLISGVNNIGATNDQPGSQQIRLENCILRSWHINFAFAGASDLQVELKNNTVYNQGSAVFAGDKGTAHIAAEGNIFHRRSDWNFFELPDWRKQVRWQGKNNLYCGKLFRVLDENQQFQRWATLEDWANLWHKPEEDSRLIDQLEPLFARSMHLPVAELRTIAEPFAQAARERFRLPELGCNWDLVGPGEAYIAAHAAANGESKEFRPEVSDGGPISLLRENREVASYRTLDEAVVQAQDQDVIELRTDKELPPIFIDGDSSRHLTIRAGAGYAPILKGMGSITRDTWNLEGLTLAGTASPASWSGQEVSERGGFHRIANCTVLPDGHNRQGWRMLPVGDVQPTVVNSRLFALHAVAPKGVKIRLENCVLSNLDTGEGAKLAGTGNIELANCTVWAPDPSTPTSIATCASTNYTVRHCHFVTPNFLLYQLEYQTAEPPAPWHGEGNVYSAPYRYFLQGRGNPSGMEQWQKFVIKEEGSFEDLSPTFDPRLWTLMPTTSGCPGADLGKVATPSDAPKLE